MGIFKRYYKSYVKSSSLYENGIYILLTSFSGIGLGFFFWLIAARLYSKYDVGVAAALISSLSLILLLSRVGLDNSAMRFYPEKNSNSIFNTYIFITLILSIILSIIYADIFIKEFADITMNSSYFKLGFILLALASSLISTSSNIFIILRKAKFSFIQNILMFSRIVLLLPLAFSGSFGILASYGISMTLAILVAYIYIQKMGININTDFNFKFLADTLSFSIGNYISNIFLLSPNYIIPPIILYYLGPEKNADFYIALGFGSIISIIPSAISTSLTVEGSHGAGLRNGVIRSIILITFILIPIGIFFYSYGGSLLELAGSSYKEGIDLLRIITIANIIGAPVSICIAIFRVKKIIKDALYVSIIYFMATIFFSIYLIQDHGLMGIGYAWLLSNIFSSVSSVYYMTKYLCK